MSGLVIDLTLSFVVGDSWYICGRYFLLEYFRITERGGELVIQGPHL